MDSGIKVYKGLMEILEPFLNASNSFSYTDLLYQIRYEEDYCIFMEKRINDFKSDYSKLLSCNKELAESLRNEYYSIEKKIVFEESLVEYQKKVVKQISWLEDDLGHYFHEDEDGTLTCNYDNNEPLHKDVGNGNWEHYDIKLKVIPTTVYEYIETHKREIPKKHEVLSIVGKYRETINTFSNFLYPIQKTEDLEIELIQNLEQERTLKKVVSLLHYLDSKSVWKLKSLHQDETKQAEILSILTSYSNKTIRITLNEIRNGRANYYDDCIEELEPILKLLERQ